MLRLPDSAARVLPRLADLVSEARTGADAEQDKATDAIYSLALDCVETLLRAGQDDKALAAIDQPKTRERFDVAIRAIEVRRDPEAKAKLATERLALVEAFLERVNAKIPEEQTVKENNGRQQKRKRAARPRHNH